MTALLVALLALSVGAPSSAHAYSFDEDYAAAPSGTGQVCPGPVNDAGFPLPGFEGPISRLIYCTKETVVAATNTFLEPFSEVMADTVSTCMLLAIVLWGALMVTGRTTAPVRDLAVMLVKIGCVMLFTWNFGKSAVFPDGLYPALLDAMSDMLTRISGYLIFELLGGLDCDNIIEGSEMMIWQQVDCTMELLLGGIIYPVSYRQPSPGVLGFLVAAFFSGAAGIFIALMGFWLVIQFVLTIATAIYIYVIAYIAFSLMVLISPIFIPMILFRVTKPYFDRWLKTTLGFILQPIFLFAYLGMLILAMNYVVLSGPNSLYYTILGEEMDREDEFRSFGDSLYWRSAYGEGSQGNYGIKVDTAAAVQALGMPKATDTGVVGITGDQAGASADTWRTGIFDNFLGPRRFFKVDWPTNRLDWQALRLINDPEAFDSCTDQACVDTSITIYLVNVFLAFIMTLVTAFIFYSLLKVLPFVGSGLTAEAFSSVPFGVGNLAPAGSKKLEGLSQGIAKRFGAGGG